MRALPPPEFVKIDPAAIEAALIKRYEERSGKTLYPAQIERLFIDQIAYSKTLVLSAIQHAGEQLLVRFSGGATLDYLGELVGTPRLLAKPARCSILFSAAGTSVVPRVIPARTAVTSQDGKVVFRTDFAAIIPAGQLQVAVTATCEQAGEIGNGWALGQIAALPSLPFDGLAASNSTASADGSEDEKDERYKERIILAPEAYTNAGSRGAYRFHAMSTHQSIIDVAVHGPDEGQEDGHVALYPLTTTGAPSADLLLQVDAQVSGEKRRPLCDRARAHTPTEVGFVIRAGLTFYSSSDRGTSMAAARAAAEAHVAELRAGLGRDIVPEQITAALKVSGVYRPVVDEPASVQVVAGNEWANCTGIELYDAGLVDG